MRYNKLGSTGLFVSELCLGTMTFGAAGQYGHMGNVGQDDADAMLGAALDAGINLIDTADTYSGGASERLTGQALKNLQVRRDQIIVASKVFGETGSGPNDRGAARGHILSAVHGSLQRLQLDYLDLYQLHGFDPATPMLETLRALDDLLRQGLVRYVGVSNWTAWQVSQALGLARQHGLTCFATLQAYYSLAGRDSERELLPMAASEGLGTLVWSPLAGGLLSGQYSRDQACVAGSRVSTFQFPPVQMDRAYAVIDVLAAMAQRKHASVAQLALAWLLHQRSVSSVIVGAKRLAQLQDNLGATELDLSAEELAELSAVSALPAEYPGWMSAMWSQSRHDQLAAGRHGVAG